MKYKYCKKYSMLSKESKNRFILGHNELFKHK